MSAAPTLAQVVAALESRYDPAWAEPWDAVGLVCGDPDAVVRRVLFAVDPVAAVADEAEAVGAELVVTHHPLFLSPVHGVAATTPKGRLVHRLVTGGRALFVAHTNADVADPGVSDALAAALGLRDVAPLRPLPDGAVDKLVTFVPTADLEHVFAALAAAGAGSIGDYDLASFRSAGTGTFRPGVGTDPYVGTPGELERVEEVRLEMVLPRSSRAAVVAALIAAHPYEEVAYDVIELAPRPSPRGLGRIGTLEPPTTLAALVERAAAVLPAGAGGVRATGDPDRPIRTVAVCGGSGDSLIGAATAAGADAYVTGDLKHHRAADHVEAGGPALLDATHFGTEWPWLAQAADLLVADLTAAGTTVDAVVSTRVTDPWTLHRPAATAPDPLAEGSRR